MKKTSLFALAFLLIASPVLARENEVEKNDRKLDDKKMEVRQEIRKTKPTSTVQVSSTTKNIKIYKKDYLAKTEALRKVYLAAKKKAEADKKAAIKALNAGFNASSTALKANRKEDFKKAEADYKAGKALLKQSTTTVKTTLKDLRKQRAAAYTKSQTEHLKDFKAINTQYNEARKAITAKFQADMKAARTAYETALKTAKAEYEAKRK